MHGFVGIILIFVVYDQYDDDDDDGDCYRRLLCRIVYMFWICCHRLVFLLCF